MTIALIEVQECEHNQRRSTSCDRWSYSQLSISSNNDALVRGLAKLFVHMGANLPIISTVHIECARCLSVPTKKCAGEKTRNTGMEPHPRSQHSFEYSWKALNKLLATARTEFLGVSQ
jgi:hypothetical protein